MHSSSQDSLVTSHRRRGSLTLSHSLDSEERVPHPLSLSRLPHSLTLTLSSPSPTLTLSSPSLPHSHSLVSLTLTLSSPSLTHSHSLVSEERGPSLTLTLSSSSSDESCSWYRIAPLYLHVTTTVSSCNHDLQCTGMYTECYLALLVLVEDVPAW